MRVGLRRIVFLAKAEALHLVRDRASLVQILIMPIIQLLVWMRVPGDTIFSVGALSLAWFVLRLWIAPKRAGVTLPEGTQAATER